MTTHCPICLAPLDERGDCWRPYSNCEYESRFSKIKPLTEEQVLKKQAAAIRYNIWSNRQKLEKITQRLAELTTSHVQNTPTTNQ